MCGDFVQMLNCALWGWRGPAFFSLRMLISLMEPEQSADAQDRMSFFLCAVVGCWRLDVQKKGVFPA